MHERLLDHSYTIENVLLEYPKPDIILLGDYGLPSASFYDSKNSFKEYVCSLNSSQLNRIVKYVNGVDEVISNIKTF